MAIQVITKEDLNQFKLELLNELKQIFQSQKQEPIKQFVRLGQIYFQQSGLFHQHLYLNR
jgi:hypothetical protein